MDALKGSQVSFPYLTLDGFRLRTVMPSPDVDIVETAQPGFTQTRLDIASSYVNSRLRKRYGTSTSASSLPLGQRPPALVAAGTTPPTVTLTGRPTLGSWRIVIQIVAPGTLGAAAFKWSGDGGTSWSAALAAATFSPLTGTGMAAVFASGSYALDDVYAAATPVPETVLGWLVALVTVDLYRKRGVNPQDPTIEMVREDATRALAELKEAADSKDGLFDLPASEDNDSAVTTGGPLGYTEFSPYTWTDIERANGRTEDIASGTQRFPDTTG